jgi:hypothetical protein
MIGTFSLGEPGSTTGSNQVQQYRFHERGEIDYALVYEDGHEVTFSRTWERRGANAVAIHAGADDEKAAQGDVQVISRLAECGPYQIQHFRDNEAISSGGAILRGALCLRPTGGCPPPGGECDGYVYDWCDEPPEPPDGCPLEGETSDGDSSTTD